MVTGDNIRTAVSVARECGMVNYHDHVYIPTFIEGDMLTANSTIEWTHVEDERLKLDSHALKPIKVLTDNSSELTYDMNDRAYHLAVSGDVFRWMVDYGSSETLQRVCHAIKHAGLLTNFVLFTAPRPLCHLCSYVA